MELRPWRRASFLGHACPCRPRGPRSPPRSGKRRGQTLPGASERAWHRKSDTRLGRPADPAGANAARPLRARARCSENSRVACLELDKKEGGREDVRQGTPGIEGAKAMLMISMATIPCYGLRCAVPRCADLRPTALHHATLPCDALCCVVDQVAIGVQNLTELIWILRSSCSNTRSRRALSAQGTWCDVLCHGLCYAVPCCAEVTCVMPR